MPKATTAKCPINDDPDNDLQRFAADLEGLVMLGRVLSVERLISPEQEKLNAEGDAMIVAAYAEVARVYKEAGIDPSERE